MPELEAWLNNTNVAMKILQLLFVGVAAASLTSGCRTDYGTGSPYQAGAVAGKTAGASVGAAAGNVAAFGVGAAEGAGAGAASAFNPNYHLVRYWKTETTPDGRTIQVPYDILVDQYGRPAKMPAPTGNPAPPPATNSAAQ